MAVHRVINEDVLQRWQSEMDQYVNDKWKTIVPGVSCYFQLVRCSYAPSGECISDDCPKRLQLHLNYHQVSTGRIYLRPLNLGFFFTVSTILLRTVLFCIQKSMKLYIID